MPPSKEQFAMLAPSRFPRFRLLRMVLQVAVLCSVFFNYIGLDNLWEDTIIPRPSTFPAQTQTEQLNDSHQQTAVALGPVPRKEGSGNASATVSPTLEQYQEGPTFLLGIPTVEGEVQRRQAVRDTYLSFYRDLYSQDQPNRICSLEQVKHNRALLRECQLIYLFFVGGNPDGPSELVAPNASFPMTVKGSLNEDDLVYLNIRENLEDGKSQTFFKYASILSKEIPFDYIGKIDSDTLLFVPEFLNFAALNLPQRPDNRLVYGGNTHLKTACDKDEIDSTHPCPFKLVGDHYFGGAFYWMSPDLAEFITSDAVPRDKLSIRHEDADIGNFVFSYPLVHKSSSIHSVKVSGPQLLIHPRRNGNWMVQERQTAFRHKLWAHSLNSTKENQPGPYFKNLRHYRKFWRQYQAYWLSNKSRITTNMFQLYDLPEAPGKTFVRTNDYIYSDQDFDSSPIVLESHKLIFFPISGVGGIEWRQLIRRLMGFDNWRERDRQFDGLVYLSDFNHSQASSLMMRPDYIRAVFVRDPKLRLLAAYLELVVPDQGKRYREMCCKALNRCSSTPSITFDLFTDTVRDCDMPYWRPQSDRMEPRYLKHLNFIGHYDSIQDDAERLLKSLNAWEPFGKSGWGPSHQDSIFSEVPYLQNETMVREYLSPTIEKAAQKFYKSDYDAKALFDFHRKLQLERIID